MGVVDVQIEHRPAALSAGCRSRAATAGSEMIRLKCPPKQPAVLAALDRLVGESGIRGRRAARGRSSAACPTCLAASTMRVASAGSSAIGFSQKTCLPASQGGDGHFGVPGRRQANVDQIELRVGEQLVELGVAGDARRGP